MEIIQICRATRPVLAALHRLLPQLDQSIPLPDKATLTKTLQQKNFILLALRGDNGNYLGIASIYIQSLVSKHTAWIEDVVVDETSRGQGIGKALTEALINIARDNEISEINLTSRPEREAANALYQKLGFVKRNTNVYRLTLESK